MRCEDFPACGHYEADTGDIFCREATMTAEEREEQAIRDRAEREIAALRKKREAREAFENAPSEHDEEKCEDKPCKECLVEIDAHEQEYAHLQEYAHYLVDYD
jgi:hypothetical protein